jgi:hypothetical protein
MGTAQGAHCEVAISTTFGLLFCLERPLRFLGYAMERFVSSDQKHHQDMQRFSATRMMPSLKKSGEHFSLRMLSKMDNAHQNLEKPVL